MRIVLGLDAIINRRRAELEEETRQRGAARATVKPKDDGIVLGIIARLEEPYQVRY